MPDRSRPRTRGRPARGMNAPLAFLIVSKILFGNAPEDFRSGESSTYGCVPRHGGGHRFAFNCTGQRHGPAVVFEAGQGLPRTPFLGEVRKKYRGAVTISLCDVFSASFSFSSSASS
jgi:hypothetical protein